MDEHTEKTGLGFFGTVTASISHEIKNRMAIINEQAGLLEDLVLMAERSGQPVDLATIKRLSGSVKDQVRRGDFIIKNMNRFAHSADAPRQTVELKAMLDLTAHLAARAASLKGARLQVDADGPEVNITTDPFPLIHLIWVGIASVLEAAAPGDVLHLNCQEGAEPAVIRIFRGSAEKDGAPQTVPADGGRLAKSLGAAVQSDPTNGSWVIQLPKGGPVHPPGDQNEGDSKTPARRHENG